MARGKSAKEKAAITERRTLALELRKEGWSYRAIGAKLEIDHTIAYDDVQFALEALVKERDAKAEDLRHVEVMRLDDLIKALYPMAKVGHVPSVMAFIKVSESRRKLLGLDAPAKFEGSLTIEWEQALQAQGIDPAIFKQVLASDTFNQLLIEAHQAAESTRAE